MTRVLRRPMFRLGGNTDQGIMSGVVPRQGYVDARLVEQLPEFQKIAEQYAYLRNTLQVKQKQGFKDMQVSLIYLSHL